VNLTKYAVLVVCLAGSFIAAAANSTSNQTDRSGDEAAIRRIDAAWSHATETKDLDGTVAPYAADGSVLPFNAPIATGTTAIRQVWSSLMSKPGFHLTFVPTKIVVAGRNIGELRPGYAGGTRTAPQYRCEYNRSDGAEKTSRSDAFGSSNPSGGLHLLQDSGTLAEG
jgi:hypothetical protein